MTVTPDVERLARALKAARDVHHLLTHDGACRYAEITGIPLALLDDSAS